NRAGDRPPRARGARRGPFRWGGPRLPLAFFPFFGHTRGGLAGRREGGSPMPKVEPDSDQTRGLLERADRGAAAARAELLTQRRRAVYAFVEVRLAPRLRTRLDASDVVQEVHLDAMRRFDDYLRRRPMPFHLWLRRTAHERLLMLRRQHLGAQRRAA